MQDLMAFVPFVAAIMFFACGLVIFLIFTLFRYREYPGGTCMIFVLIALLIWTFFQGLEIISFSLSVKVLLSQLSYIGIAPLSPLVFLFIYHYTQQLDWRSNAWGKWLLVIPILIIIMVFTNHFHGLVWTRFTWSSTPGESLLIYHYGPLSWLNVAYAYLLLLAGLVLLAREYSQHGRMHKKRILWLIVSILIPWAGSIAYVFRLTPFQGIDFAPIAFTITSAIFVLIFIKYQLLTIKPIAYEWLFSSMKDGVLVFDKEHRLMLINNSAKQWIKTKKELPGSEAKYLFCSQHTMKDLLENNSSKILIASAEKSQSMHQWLEIEKSSLYQSKRQIIGTLVQIRDITESKSQEEKLKKLQLQQQALLDNLPFIAWFKDIHGNYLAVNKKYQEAAGIPFHKIIDKKDPDIWPEALARQYVKNDDTVMHSQKTHIAEEKLETDEGIFWVETHKAPMLDDQGKAEGTTGFARDITEQKNLELAKNEFISMVSHEMRTPLTSIINSMKMMLDSDLGPLNERQKEILHIGKRNANRLARFINDVLDFEKMKNPGFELHFSDEPIADIIHEAIAMLQPLFNKEVEIKTSIAEDLPLIKMDREKMMQVMINLINNAMKFTEKGAVTISASFDQEKGSLLVGVEDTGIGIKKEDMKKVFATFVQVSPASYRKPESSGLGLSICQEIILKHAGKIWVQSQWGKGSTFFFNIPRKQY